jgi:hypothetical protein
VSGKEKGGGEERVRRSGKKEAAEEGEEHRWLRRS